MAVVLQNDLAELFKQHEKYLKGAAGGKRLDISLQTGHELDFSKKILPGAEFVGAFLNHSNFSGAHLEQANFFGATLNNVNFIEAILTQADMRGAQMHGVNFTNAFLNEANLGDGSLLRQGVGGEINPVHVGDAKLRLLNAVFKNATAQRAKFSSSIALSTDLSMANFKGAKLTGVNFSGSNMQGATLENADLRGCNFSNTNMNAVILLNANVEGATFEGADLTASLVHLSASSSHGAFNHAKMPKSLDNLEYSIKEIIASHKVWVSTLGREGKRADLVGINLANVILDGVQFQAASLKNSLLTKGSFKCAVFAMSDLTGCNAREASFVKADCRGTNFSMARLDGADMQFADCSPMQIARNTSKSVQWPTNFAGCNLQSALLRGANLSGAHFDNATLAGADLREANLEGASFLDADFTGADLRGALLDKADLRGAVGMK